MPAAIASLSFMQGRGDGGRPGADHDRPRGTLGAGLTAALGLLASRAARRRRSVTSSRRALRNSASAALRSSSSVLARRARHRACLLALLRVRPESLTLDYSIS